MGGRRDRLVWRFVAVTLVAALTVFTTAGCDGGEEEEVVPQRFIYDFDAKKAAAAGRKPVAFVEREIPAGTMFPVRLLSRLSSANARVGDVFGVEVLQDVVVDDAVVIPVGAFGQGRVAEAEPAKGWGKGGRLRISLDYVLAVDGQRVPVEANEQTAGRDQEVFGAGTVAGVVLLGPIWLLAPATAKGKNVVLPADTQFYVMVKMPVKVKAHIY